MLDATASELKATQRITGRSGQLGYRVESNNAWDLTLALPYVEGPALSAATFKVTYTSNGKQKFPIVVPLIDLRFNGTGEGNKLTGAPGGDFFTYEDANGYVLMGWMDRPDHTLFESETQLAWTFNVLYRGNITLRVKPRAQATCDGTLTVARIA